MNGFDLEVCFFSNQFLFIGFTYPLKFKKKLLKLKQLILKQKFAAKNFIFKVCLT